MEPRPAVPIAGPDVPGPALAPSRAPPPAVMPRAPFGAPPPRTAPFRSPLPYTPPPRALPPDVIPVAPTPAVMHRSSSVVMLGAQTPAVVPRLPQAVMAGAPRRPRAVMLGPPTPAVVPRLPQTVMHRSPTNVMTGAPRPPPAVMPDPPTPAVMSRAPPPPPAVTHPYEHAAQPIIISNNSADSLLPAMHHPAVSTTAQLGCDLVLETDDCNEEASHDTEIHPPPISSDGFSTPKKRASRASICGSSCTPECDDNLKPVVGMTFDCREAVEEFYKAYAHNVGFSVRIGQNKTVANEVVWKLSLRQIWFSNKEGGGTKEGFEWREEKNTCENNYSMWL